LSLWRRVLVERRSILLPLAVFLAVNVVVLVVGVLPLRQSVAGMENERYNASVQLGAARQAQNDAERAATSKRQASEGLQKFYAQILAADSFSAMTAVHFWPQRTAQALGLQYTNIETSSPTEVRDSRLMKLTSRFALRGEYANIRKFVYAVEAAEEFLVIDKLKLAQPPAQQANTPALGFELSITTYYLGGGK
jgi:Tfp pilus assembly protein PilO